MQMPPPTAAPPRLGPFRPGPSPGRAAVVAIALYLAMLLGLAAHRQFNLTVFIFAGDEYSNPVALAPPIAVAPHSLGYDGQFFYRFALDPWSTDPTADGITLDAPAKRMQRIVYPMLARLLALARPGWLPASLIAVNLAGLGLLAATAAWLTRRHGLAWWLPYAVMAWPGLLVALAHDTAEITTAALLLAALACYLSDRLILYALLAAAAALTRETALPILLGILLAEGWAWITTANTEGAARRLLRPLLCGLAMLPFALWWLIVSQIWHQAPQSPTGSPDLGWPFLGLARMLLATLNGTRHWKGDAAGEAITRLFVVATALGLLGFGLLVALRLPRLRHRPRLAGPALGWLLTAFLMSLLAADGPWIEPLSYFRAFTEFWLVGCLLLAHAPPAWMRGRLLCGLAALAALEANLVIWKWSLWLIR